MPTIGLFRQKYPDVAVQLHVPPHQTALECGKWTVRPSNWGGVPSELQDSLKLFL